ncbi:MAG TPA: XdhC family protein [Stellaceae bacterium]|nr:XdhC family protein [Stellaceae bacterium]
MTPAVEDPFALIADLRQRGEDFCVVTVVRTQDATSAKAGAKAVVLRDGTIRGLLGGGCVQAAIRKTAAAVLAEGRPRLIRVKPQDQATASVDIDGTELHRSACPSGGTVDLFVEPLRRAPRLIVCGASPVALALADLGRRLGYRIAVAALADDQGLFGEADERVSGFDLSSLAIIADDWIAVATQGKRDREALAAALASGANYVAFVGSRRKAQVLSRQIREQGVLSEDRIARLKAPAGLDIHAIEPAEIALSIMAEIIARRRAAIGMSNREAGAVQALA